MKHYRHDGDMNIDVPADKIATETDGISINGEWLAEILPADYACDMTFTLTTAEGNATSHSGTSDQGLGVRG